MTTTMEIKKENLLAAYNGASAEQKQLLENLFGTDVFKPKDITERVKTFEDACRELGNDHPFVEQYSTIEKTYRGEKHTCDFIAYLKLRIIVASLNEGWEPQFTEDEYRWYPWFELFTQEEYNGLSDEAKARVPLRSSSYASACGGLVCAVAYNASSNSNTNCGSRLAFRTEELARYAGRQFIHLWADFCFKAEEKAG